MDGRMQGAGVGAGCWVHRNALLLSVYSFLFKILSGKKDFYKSQLCSLLRGFRASNTLSRLGGCLFAKGAR